MSSAEGTISRTIMETETGTTYTEARELDILQRVLVIRLGAFGDVVRTIPAVDALKDRYPSAEITWLVDESSANILEKLECLDSVITLSRKSFFRDISSARSALREIRRRKFTCVLDFHGLSRSGLFSLLSGCRYRVGFAKRHVREFNSMFNNFFVDPGTDFISRYEKNHSLVELFDVPPKKEPPVLNIPIEEKNEVNSFLDSLGGKGFVCLHPGTSWRGRYKRWFPKKFSAVADHIIENYGLDVVLLFTEEERGIVEEIASKTRNELQLSPKVNQRQLAYIIGKAVLYVGLDSGSMHVASLVKTPIVALFGPTNIIHDRPYHYAPYRLVHGDADCAPCRVRDCDDRVCMHSIEPQHVTAAIDELLEEIIPAQAPQESC